MRVLLLFVLAAATAASCGRIPLVSADDRALRVVLGRYLRVVGGNAAWDTVRTRVTHGRAELAPPGATAQFMLVEAPERRLFTLQLPNGAVQREGFDGRGGWVQSPRGEVRDEPAGLTASAGRERRLARDPRLGAYRSFTMLPREDHFHARLAARTVDGVIDTLHFEHSSGLLVRRDIGMATLQGRVRVQIHYEDYRRVGGVRVPFRIRQVRPDRTFTMQVDSVRFNVPLAPSAFERPQSAQPESFGDRAIDGPHQVGFTVMHLRDRALPWETAGDSAAPVRELLPLVVYSQGLNSSLQHDNLVHAEVVASHGFLVVQVPPVGRSADDFRSECA